MQGTSQSDSFGDAITAVILAGGKGTRIAALYPNTPKPMIPVVGHPFLHWVTAWVVGQGIRDVVYSVGHLAEQIQAWVTGLEHLPGVRLRYRGERVPLGTGGGALNCLDLCAESVLVLNGDSLVLVDIEPAFARFRGEDLDGIIIATEVPDASRYGSLETDDAGLLCGFHEKRSGRGLINCGVYLFRHQLLESGRIPRAKLAFGFFKREKAVLRGRLESRRVIAFSPSEAFRPPISKRSAKHWASRPVSARVCE